MKKRSVLLLLVLALPVYGYVGYRIGLSSAPKVLEHERAVEERQQANHEAAIKALIAGLEAYQRYSQTNNP